MSRRCVVGYVSERLRSESYRAVGFVCAEFYLSYVWMIIRQEFQADRPTFPVLFVIFSQFVENLLCFNVE